MFDFHCFSLSLSPDSRPTLQQLTKMISPSGKTIQIINHIAADWHNRVGIHLNFDPTGRTLALIRAHNPSDPKACCIDMMKEWLEGKGRQPANWATLLRVLKDAEFCVLAEEVEQLLVTGGLVGRRRRGRGAEGEGERRGWMRMER